MAYAHDSILRLYAAATHTLVTSLVRGDPLAASVGIGGLYCAAWLGAGAWLSAATVMTRHNLRRIPEGVVGDWNDQDVRAVFREMCQHEPDPKRRKTLTGVIALDEKPGSVGDKIAALGVQRRIIAASLGQPFELMQLKII